MNKKILTLIGILCLSSSLQAQSSFRESAKTLFGIVEKNSAFADELNAEQVALGKELFFDFRLSKDNSTACVRCHWPMYYGADKLPQSMGFNNNMGARNSQSILNLKYQTVTHWRGDRTGLEEQAQKAFTTPLSLGHASEADALKRLADLGYEAKFKRVFSNTKKSLSLENAAKALTQYQLALTTPAPFDLYMAGDEKAISEQAKFGAKRFMEIGCASCHNGPAIGGRSMQKFGLSKNYWEVTGTKSRDAGRFEITKNENDRNIFKVPSLRNIEKTAPYFHDASTDSLEQAVKWMAELQLNHKINKKDLAGIVEFLKSLTGEIPEELTKTPVY